jgi:hypothetical protein
MSEWSEGISLILIGIPATVLAIVMASISYRTDSVETGLKTMQILALCLIAMAILSGCAGSPVTPYIAARHVSDPGIRDDGWDLGCAGAKYRGQLTLKAGYCWNARGGNMAEASIEYDLFGEH